MFTAESSEFEPRQHLGDSQDHGVIEGMNVMLTSLRGVGNIRFKSLDLQEIIWKSENGNRIKPGV